MARVGEPAASARPFEAAAHDTIRHSIEARIAWKQEAREREIEEYQGLVRSQDVFSKREREEGLSEAVVHDFALICKSNKF